MNILDIAIAKKLAGGGGGSGTDNYNDLSNLPKINDTTLSGNKSSSALGLQSEINSDSKLASDLVDDTNQDNKFVTSTEKNTWNGKQNAIDADHKLSSDLVDDANKTNKFVTSTEKQTWNNKQNAIDSDHKLSSSLVSFTTAEAAALASGIDSRKVGQISTNQTNILYAINNGVKNRLNYNAWETVGVTGGQAVFENNGVTLTASSGDCYTLQSAASFPVDARIYVTEGEVIVLSWDYEKASSANGYAYIFPEGNVSGSKNAEVSARKIEYTVPANVSYITFRVGVNSGSGHVIKYKDIMVCEKVFYDEDQSFLPSALPNYDLTRLEAEDRAALVEVVDGGAKNLLDTSTTTVSNVTFTQDSNSYITASPNNADTRPWNYANAQYKLNLKAGTYVFAMDIKTATSNTGIGFNLYSSNGTSIIHSETSEILSKTGMITWQFTITTEGTYGVVYKCFDMVARLMVCTKAAFGVSQKFVPYRPNYDFVCSGRVAPRTSATLTSGNLNDFPTSYYLCTGAVANLPEYTGYAIVKTIVIDENAALQEAFTLNSSGNKSYMRTKWNGTWNPWVLNTNASS